MSKQQQQQADDLKRAIRAAKQSANLKQLHAMRLYSEFQTSGASSQKLMDAFLEAKAAEAKAAEALASMSSKRLEGKGGSRSCRRHRVRHRTRKH